jgi:hypothetical protein
MKDLARPHLLGLVAGLFLAAGLVLSAMLFTRAWIRVAEPQTITVKGSAKRHVESDLAIWKGRCLVEAGDLLTAQHELKADMVHVETFLRSRAGTNYSGSPIQSDEVRLSERDEGRVVRTVTVGYRLSQTVRVAGDDVEGIVQLDHDSTVLVEQGVLFTPFPIEFIFTRAGEAKVEMLDEATRDARERAERIATQGGVRIAGLRSAAMGVFQITPIHSSETSWQGIYDRRSRQKTITAVVSAGFALH